MYTPHSLEIALLMMITSAICWGSWANTYKGVKKYRFELFYWDYAIGIFLISLILGHTMGMTSHDGTSLVENLHGASWNDVIRHLDDHHIRAIAAPNPLRSVQEDAATVSSLVASLTGPVILVGYAAPSTDFDDCRAAAVVENGVDLDNEEQGGTVFVCARPRQPWNEIWPSLRHLDA